MLLLLRVGIPTCRFSHESSQSHVLASSVVDSFRVSELGEPYWPDHARVPAPLTASGTGSLPSRSRPNTFHVLQPAMIENERLGRYARRAAAARRTVAADEIGRRKDASARLDASHIAWLDRS